MNEIGLVNPRRVTGALCSYDDHTSFEQCSDGRSRVLAPVVAGLPSVSLDLLCLTHGFPMGLPQ